MDDVKLRLAGTVAGKLSAAPASAAKDELVEELSDNLYRRFLDMTGAGVPEDEAFRRALDDLGDVDELLAYLGVEPAGDVTTGQREGQIRVTSSSGKTVVISDPGNGEAITINSGDGRPLTIQGDEEGEAARGETETSGKEAGSAFEGDINYGYQPEGTQDGQGGPRYDRQAPQSDLDAILAGVSEACNTAIDQAKTALKQAKEAIQRRTVFERDDRRVRVHFNTRPDAPKPGEDPARQAPPPPPHDGPAPHEPPPPQGGPGRQAPPPPPRQGGPGWEFEAELNADEGRFFAGGGPRERADVVYGFGYDKARGGFFTQWGEDPEGRGSGGPYFTGEDASMTHNDDGSYSVTALRDLRGIEVSTRAGDVSIHMSEASDAGVIIDGDVDDLDVTCSADGVLTIREGRTASSSFFSRRGFTCADVELFLPRRRWEAITVTTASGDVDIDRGELDVDYLTVTTANGDLSCRLQRCGVLSFKSASGDLDLKGACTTLLAETMSGDMSLTGPVEDAQLRSASGDIELDGPVRRFQGTSMSGDVQLISPQLPEVMDLSSKSGDCQVRLPDAGPFTLRFKTVSGEAGFSFPFRYDGRTAVYGDGSGPAYSMTTISGDLSLDRY